MKKDPKFKQRDRDVKYRHKSPLEKFLNPLRKGITTKGSVLLTSKRVGKTIKF